MSQRDIGRSARQLAVSLVAHGELKATGTRFDHRRHRHRSRDCESRRCADRRRVTRHGVESVALVYRLLREEGLFLGSTSGVNVAAAVQSRASARPGSHNRDYPVRHRREVSIAFVQSQMARRKGSARCSRPRPTCSTCFYYGDSSCRRLPTTTQRLSSSAHRSIPMPSSSAPGPSACSRCSNWACWDQGPRDRFAAGLGGQCVELYPDKPIYDIPAVPVCTGQELTDNLLKQIEPFDADLPPGPGSHRGRSAGRRPLQRRDLAPARGSSPRPSSSPPASARSSRARSRSTASRSSKARSCTTASRIPSLFAGKNLVICGGGDSALDWALNFVGKAEAVVLVHRREDFRAAPASVAKMRRCATSYEMQFDHRPGHRLRREGRPADRSRRSPAPTASPAACRSTCCWCSSACRRSSGPIAEWGLDIERKQLKVGHREVRDQRAGHLRGGRHQHLSGQEEADPVGLPRSGAGGLRGRAEYLPGQEDPPAVHDDEPDHAQAPRRFCRRRGRAQGSE